MKRQEKEAASFFTAQYIMILIVRLGPHSPLALSFKKVLEKELAFLQGFAQFTAL